MGTTELDVKGKILDSSDVVSLSIDIVPQIRDFMSYGYGQYQSDLSLTYFDAFDLIGNLTGYLYEPDIVLPVDNMYYYGFGYEYTEMIRQSVDYLDININVSPSGIYQIVLHTDGPGFPYLYYDTGDFGYYPTYDTGRYHVYKGDTNINGNLTCQIGVPFETKAMNYSQLNPFNNEVVFKIFELNGSGLFNVYVTVLDKIVQQDPIPVMGTINIQENTLSLDCKGTIN